MQTEIHRLVESCRDAGNPRVIARLRSGWAVMAERQVIAGYCLLLPDPVVAHLNCLERAGRAGFLSDMALLGDALIEVTGAIRINYAMFGNVEPALHAHLFPRLASESAAAAVMQPWALDWSLAPSYSEAVHGALRSRLTAVLSGVFSPPSAP